MGFVLRHLPKLFIGAAVCMLIAGICMGEHNMILSYAIVVCLSCMGIG